VGWKPATIDDVKAILSAELKSCDAQQIEIFRRYSVEPFRAVITRYGKIESVVVVAKKSDEVIYWEDVEEGFNISPTGPQGEVLEHWCNQDDLAVALNRLVQPRDCRSGNFDPARPLKS
jgi:hypothetical protein